MQARLKGDWPAAAGELCVLRRLKPDGTLDYARLTVREIGEDLEESLMDRVVNGFQHELEPFLEKCPDLDSLPASDPPRPLVDAWRSCCGWRVKTWTSVCPAHVTWSEVLYNNLKRSPTEPHKHGS